MNPLLPRREFLSKASLTTIFGTSALVAKCAENAAESDASTSARDYLRRMLYTREEVQQWLEGRAFPFAKYSSEFGWLLRNARFSDGVDGAVNTYTYGPLDERITIHYREQPCRINTYGNSFTQCHQVSDAETWQEILAGHLQEPVRNFGVGGWSVYQAWLRLVKEEQRVPAQYIIFNIYDDDHFRNLDSWRNLRIKKHEQFIEPPLPYAEVDVGKELLVEKPNPCPTADSLYHLCDLDWVVDRFKDDFVLSIMLAHARAKGTNSELKYGDALKLATTHGIATRTDDARTSSSGAAALHRRTAYYASQRIVEKIEKYAQEHGKRMLYVLSYPAQGVARFVTEGARPDQPFVDFMQRKGVTVIDLLQAHANDFKNYRGSINDYLKQYFIGHYTPRGNFFTAWAIKERLVELLELKPTPYRKEGTK